MKNVKHRKFLVINNAHMAGNGGAKIWTQIVYILSYAFTISLTASK